MESGPTPGQTQPSFLEYDIEVIAAARPGVGEFWPEDIDVSLCDVIYYGFGNVLNDTYEVG